MKLRPSLLIEKYLNNTLSDTEELEFNNLYANDEQFREAVSCSKAIHEVIQHQKDMDMWRNRFQTWGKLKPIEAVSEKKNAPPQQKKRMRLIIASVLSLSFLISASIFILQQSKVPRRVFDTLFSPYPVSFYDTPSPEVAKMLELYRTKNYLNVVKRFGGLNEAQKDTILFYKAVSELASNNIRPAQAFSTLQTVERLQTVPKDLLQWYKALALIKLRHTEAAKIELHYIVATNSNYRGRALEALRRLE